MYRQLVRLCGNHDDAEDALIEALLKAYKASETLRDEGAFRAWLNAIARRACLRLKKKDALLSRVSLTELEQSGFQLAEASPGPSMMMAMSDCVKQALGNVPEIYREAYVLRDLEGLDIKSAADRLGIGVPALKSRHLRARKLVREALDQSFCLA